MKYILFLLFFSGALSAQVGELLPYSLDTKQVVGDTFYLDENESLETDYVRETYIAPPLAPIALREVPTDKWNKATDGMDYSKDLPKLPKEYNKREENESSLDWTGMTLGFGTLLQLIAVIFALGGIAYGIYWMMQTPRNRVISRDGTEITLANLEEYIHETDLDRFLREALASSNWPLAVRLYFLQIIKKLSEKEAIVWSKEKTNRDYLREMRSHRLSTHFLDATHQFEQVWYGNQPITVEAFAQLEPKFKSLLGEI
jgi:hypothetical protein